MKKIALMVTMLLLTVVGVRAAEPVKSAEAQALMDYLRSINGTKTLSGAMACVNWNTSEAQWVYKHTGKWPALNCFDFVHLPYSSRGGWIDYDNTDVVEQWAADGGIVAAMWHWNVPANSGRSDKYAFYWGTENDDDHTAFDVRKIFEPQSAEYQRMIADIDRVGGILKQLKQKGIAVIWRPLHEAGGRWFWWGRDAEACRELWRVMYRRFQDAGVDNLVWAFTPAAAWGQPFSAGYDFYPGDDYVDIVGYDIYNVGDARQIYTDYYSSLTSQSPTKLVALTEFGNVSTIGSQWNAGARWLFFMPWYDWSVSNNVNGSGFQGTSHGNADITWWQEALSHDYVLTRDQLPQLTAISPVRADASAAEQPFYTLDGRRVERPTHPGVYIHGRRKVVVR